MLVLQKKTPNVVKAIVEHPKLPEIKIAIYGLDCNGNPKIEVLKAPYNHNLCASINPYYNGLNEVKKAPQSNAQEENTKKTHNTNSRNM
jgi:spore cortex formation protein SpoVR/YcgB (stage V sporulation)